ncbi:MAG: hypothetical protein ACR2RF_15905 [Geminicoccaceae bacterium]
MDWKNLVQPMSWQQNVIVGILIGIIVYCYYSIFGSRGLLIDVLAIAFFGSLASWLVTFLAKQSDG